MGFFPPLPPPPPPPFSTTSNGGMSETSQPQQQSYSDNNNNIGFISDDNSSINNSTPSSSSATSSIVITIIVIASAIIISATIYILLRFLSRRRSTTPNHAPPDNNTTLRNHINRRSSLSSFSSNNTLNESDNHHTELLDSLPLFTFKSLKGNLTGKECAVCLSKFEKEDQLRLLPLCCHAFHSRCIDAWLLSNESCPLCRSTVYPTDADVMNKVISVTQNANINIDNHINTDTDTGRSEINNSGGGSHGDSLGSSFEYISDDNYEIQLDCIPRRGSDFDKEATESINVVGPPGERLDVEVGGSGRNWLREYMERFASLSSSSRSMSCRSSGRFFSGSCRRNDVVVPVDEDLEANNNRAGEEISELFRWISGV